MDGEFSIEAVVNGKLQRLTVIPQAENFVIVSNDQHLLTVCFNCDYECTCVGEANVDVQTVQSIANSIQLHYLLKQ